MIEILNFQEKVYGNQAVVYHRTDSKEKIKYILKYGFKPGGGDFYGKGLYTTYKLESQLKSPMAYNYGDFIIKGRIITNGFLILDYDEAKKIYGKNYTLVEQLKQLGLIKLIDENIEEISKELEDYDYSAVFARELYTNYKINKYIKGMIFTGEHDGKVAVIYNPKNFQPLAFMYSPDGKKGEWIDLIKDIKKENFYKTMWEIYYDIKVLPFWVKQAETKDMEWKLQKNNFIFKNGTWKRGTWIDGTWENGIWIYGTWKDGVWENGVWEYGLWNDGVWKDGMWKNGIWEYGTWENGIWKWGTWEDGTWEDGTWENGEWIKGTWKDGTWKNGIRKHGTWERGTWEDGTWKNGEWISGTWKNGTWKRGTWKDGVWEDGIWERGTWEGGTWENGEWIKGTWKYGMWKDGMWENGTWKKGWIYDPKRKGKFQSNWNWDGDYVLSPISPKEYFGY